MFIFATAYIGDSPNSSVSFSGSISVYFCLNKLKIPVLYDKVSVSDVKGVLTEWMEVKGEGMRFYITPKDILVGNNIYFKVYGVS